MIKTDCCGFLVEAAEHGLGEIAKVFYSVPTYLSESVDLLRGLYESAK